MAHLDHVDLVCIDRLGRDVACGSRSLPELMAEPASRSADDESEQRGSSREPRPTPIAACQACKIEAPRHWFVRNSTVARTHGVGLRPPSRNARCIFGMALKPLLNHRAFAAGNLPIDIGMQLLFADRWLTLDHRSPHFTRRSAGRSPSRYALICARARASRDITVPIGTPCTSATSR